MIMNTKIIKESKINILNSIILKILSKSNPMPTQGTPVTSTAFLKTKMSLDKNKTAATCMSESHMLRIHFSTAIMMSTLRKNARFQIMQWP